MTLGSPTRVALLTLKSMAFSRSSEAQNAIQASWQALGSRSSMEGVRLWAKKDAGEGIFSGFGSFCIGRSVAQKIGGSPKLG